VKSRYTPRQMRLDAVIRGKRVVTPVGERPHAIPIAGGVIVAVTIYERGNGFIGSPKGRWTRRA